MKLILQLSDTEIIRRCEELNDRKPTTKELDKIRAEMIIQTKPDCLRDMFIDIIDMVMLKWWKSKVREVILSNTYQIENRDKILKELGLTSEELKEVLNGKKVWINKRRESNRNNDSS